jgi:hypothetical protein
MNLSLTRARGGRILAAIDGHVARLDDVVCRNQIGTVFAFDDDRPRPRPKPVECLDQRGMSGHAIQSNEVHPLLPGVARERSFAYDILQ